MSIRKEALRVLLCVHYEGGYSTELLRRADRAWKDPRDRALLREFVYGVLENRNYLDHVIGNFSKTPVAKIRREILEILRLGIYELLFTRVAEHATIHEAVKQSKRYAKGRLAPFVNGILRNVQRNREKILEERWGDSIKDLSIQYSHPEELIDYFLEEYGLEFTREFLRTNNTPAPIYIRTNTLKTTREDLIARLEEKGICCSSVTRVHSGIRMDHARDVTSLDEFKEGLFTIQDVGSMMAAEMLAPVPGSAILDLCAAPGGKSTHLAQLMQNTGRVVANDIDEGKLKRIRENVQRLGIDSVEYTCHDATQFRAEWENAFDKVLVDAPCSGFGLIRKKPEIRWHRKREDIEKLATIQREILNNAYRYLRSGGELVYSTCTIGSVENEKVFDDFLDRHDDLARVYLRGEKQIYLFPHLDDCDGFFIAKCKKK